MTAILHRQPGQSLPTAAGGQGVYLFDTDGRRYLDGSGGAAVSCLGHGHPDVIEAIQRQAGAMAFAHTAFFTSAPAEELASHLIARAPHGFGQVYFVSGGSEATETALKLARQYHVANGQPERRLFVSRQGSYHGNTLGALSVSGNAGRRVLFEPILPPGLRIPSCHPYRFREEGETVEAYGLRAADALETAILEAGPQRVAAFIAEPVVGATLGAVPATPGYFRRIREICDRHGVLFIADEVMCGMGRTGLSFAMEAEGAAPDIITVAKGLGGGYQPIGATLIATRIVETIVGHSGKFEHGHTYIGHATACAAALAVQQVITRDRLLDQVQARGRYLQTRLEEALGQSPHVGDIRGRGLLMGVELVEDRETRRPFDAARGVNGRIKAAAMARGLICYPGGGGADGVDGDHVLLAPPFIISEAELDALVEMLTAAIGDVVATL